MGSLRYWWSLHRVNSAWSVCNKLFFFFKYNLYVADIEANCNDDGVLVMASLKEPFYGILYAEGYAGVPDCQVEGSGRHLLRLYFNASDCGVHFIHTEVRWLSHPDLSRCYHVTTTRIANNLEQFSWGSRELFRSFLFKIRRNFFLFVVAMNLLKMWILKDFANTSICSAVIIKSHQMYEIATL